MEVLPSATIYSNTDDVIEWEDDAAIEWQEVSLRFGYLGSVRDRDH